ncbi:DNA polymerase subunit gamma-1, mitochondrial isoform X2 [Toxorhynchites rutilus septentrionalis]|uniref:DNA polymerase subunit gamma-1, mitochondrial isoform X2 n=1 Tax=Toxorhynchites rutilus septentrionalis TaxID=329112 RepID=UPI002479C213|nr:DNA polymerase subunit gamma-1, mitochondrial isoform X2 [Toxorhynchites rutilus septentrionalis]
MMNLLRLRRFGTSSSEIFPRSTVSRLSNNVSVKENVPRNEETQNSSGYYGSKPKEETGVRLNEMNIQLLSRGLYEQIFKNASMNGKRLRSGEIEALRKELTRHGIPLSRPEILPDVNFRLPKLKGNNIEQHFFQIAKEQSEPYRVLLETLINSETPPLPECWSESVGWTCYDPERGPVSVPYPNDQAFVFDVEVCVPAGAAPVMATALSPTRWYSWTSPNLVNQIPSGDGHRYQLSEMIPMESAPNDKHSDSKFETVRVVVGHNVSYDRARIREQYWLENTGMRFVDTMSLHVCVSGVTSYQRAMLKSSKDLPVEDHAWSSQSSLNNLADVYQLYCGGKLDKEKRNIFLDGSLADVWRNFQSLMRYCAGDVTATKDVLRKLLPLFFERFPHPATLAGMLEIGNAYLPVNTNWNRYVQESDLAYEDLDIEAKHLLAQRADKACRLMHDEQFRKDLWLWDQDWSVQELKLKAAKKVPKKKQPSASMEMQEDERDTTEEELDPLAKKFEYLYKTKDLLPVRRPFLPGYPTWYRNLCLKPSDEDWSPGANKIGTGMQIAPKLLRLCWEGYPLHFIRGQGWGFLVPHKFRREEESDTDNGQQIPLEQLAAACPVLESMPHASTEESAEALGNLWKNVEENISRKDYYRKVRKDKTNNAYKGTGIWCNLDLEDCCYFLRLPHKDGPTHRVGNPLSKDFLSKFSDNVLAGDAVTAERVVEIAKMLSYWRNNRDRISGQLVVWLERGDLPKHLRGDEMEYGAIVPQVVVCGTLTRRAMEPTWMTASNAQRERVGSELRAMVQTPPGYKMVGADVDSQELWIASVLGDSHAGGIHGATPFGWMTLSGTKAAKTDMHSVTAQAVGISRDHAKVINYARIYGAGQNFAERLLKQFNPTFSDAEARSKAIKMFSLTKGKKFYHLREQFQDDFPHQGYSAYEALKMAKISNKSVDELFERACWQGGTESAMFNRLEQIADSEAPVTPFLGGRLSRALEPQVGTEDRFLPTRINWVVQSGAVDFLHLMLVCMRWIMGNRLRFCLSFHDEVRYLVEERYAHRAALAMHVTNLLTRAFCVSRIGLNDLPQSVAFFSTVEVDTALRKESRMDCKTPSNPHGLEIGYGIPEGESLDIYQTLEKLGPGESDMTRWEWHIEHPSDSRAR